MAAASALRRWCLCLLVGLAGCDALFPHSPDLARPADGQGLGDGGGDLGPRNGHIEGQICVLTDLRSYQSCSTALTHGPIQVSVLETGTQLTVAADGHLSVDLQQAPPTVTLLLSDPQQQLTAGVVSLALSGPATALPMITELRREQFIAQGIPLDPSGGILLGYVVDGNGQPQAGVMAQPAAGLGPYYETGDDILILGPGTSTDQSGLFVLFNLLPGTATVTLSGTVQGSHTLPVQGAATTFSLLR